VLGGTHALSGAVLGRSAAATLTALVAAGALAGCGGDDAEAAETLTVYSAQHESLVRTMLEGFTEETGIALEFRDANDAELANQIVQEGEASPADVFLTENSPSIDVLDREGLLAPLDQATLDQVGAQFRPSSGNWTGFAARSTVLVHNPAQLPADQLPASILDLADPEWQGRIGIAAGGADFQAIVAGVLALRGE
jgi:iron(III) transport system substrate-binding protein